MISRIKNKINSSTLIKGASVSFIIRIIGMVLGYLVTLIISNYYGANVLGIYALTFVFIQMFAMMARLGMDMALVKYIAEYENKGEYFLIKKIYFMVLKLVIPFSLLVSVVAYYYSPYIADSIFHKNYLTPYFQVASLAILPYTLIFINSESLRGMHKIKEYMIFQNITTTVVILLILVIAFIYESDNMYIPILALVSAIVVTFVLSSVSWYRKIFQVTKVIQESISFKQLLSVGMPLTLTSYLTILMGSTDTIMLGMYTTESDIGIYSVVTKLSTMTLLVLMAVNTLTIPKIAALWGHRDIQAIDKLNHESTKLIVYLSLPLFLFLWVFPDFVLSIFGDEFKEGKLALILITIGQFISILCGPVWHMMNMTNKQKIFFYFSIFSTIINIVLNVLLIPLYGVTGAAFATLMSILFLNLISVLYIKKEFNLLTIYIPKMGRE